MAIATYGDIVKEIRSWTNRPDLTDENIASFIYYAGNTVNQVLRVPAMENTEIVEVSEGGKINIPEDFLEQRSLTALWNSNESVPVERVAWDQFLNYRNSDNNTGGKPRYFARQGPYLFLTPEPPIGAKVVIHYYRAMPNISAAEPLNWLSQLSPMSYLYGGLHFAYLFIFDEERSEYWKTKFQAEMDRIQMMASTAEYVGSALTVRPKRPQEIH